MLPWSFSEEAAAEKYMAQLQHNMWVLAARAIRRALEQAGVYFIDAEGGGPGVRLREPPAEG